MSEKKDQVVLTGVWRNSITLNIIVITLRGDLGRRRGAD
jgi:hypothetical protein